MYAGTFPHAQELMANARAIVADGKGILAADESTGTIGKRLASIGVENTEDNRRDYRELLFTSPGDWQQWIGGVILYEETLFQSSKDGVPFVELLQKKGVIPGIKVDKGVKQLLGTDGETVTQGIDDLGARAAKYYAQGARFAKWRSVLKISNGCPTENAIHQNAYVLARYAAICQENGLVPIVEPEILMDGEHDITVSAAITHKVLAAVYKELHNQNVLLEGTLLKPNMVLPGYQSEGKAKVTPEDVGRYTVRVLQNTVPVAVPGVVFLSGGQSEEEATLNLNAMNRVDSPRPWKLTFSFGRALQASALKAWQGKPENVAAAQKAWLTRAEANSQASVGKYAGGAAGSVDSLYVKNYSY